MSRYLFLDALGAGAAGGVYLVEDRLAGGARRALKRIQASSDPAMRSSLAREFAMLASLAVDGVARVYDLGALPESEGLPAGPYFTRDFITGAPLDDFARSHGARENLHVLVALCRIVRSLHRLGVVHGDLKPANVIVDERHKPWLIDFGLSAHVRNTDALRGSGTLPFMAPELLDGQAPSVASDVYALAATIWAVITGAPPALARRRTRDDRELVLPDGVLEPARSALAIAREGLAHTPSQRACSADELCARLEQLIDAPVVERADAESQVAPRTLGRDELLAELEAAVSDGDGQVPLSWLVLGAPGTGKSTLLRELKWRLQLAGREVVLLEGRSFGLRAGEQLRAQLTGDAGAAEPALAALLARPVRGVLLIDDLDAFEASFWTSLRELAHGDGVVPHVLATASESRPELAECFAEQRTLVPLERDAAEALVHALLGVVEPRALDRLLTHTGGNPGALVAAAAALRGTGAITCEDVDALPLEALSRVAWTRRLEGLPHAARALLCVLGITRAPLPQPLVLRWLEGAGQAATAALERRQLVRCERGALWPEPAVAEAASVSSEPTGVVEAASGLLAADAEHSLPLPVRAQLAVAARAVEQAAAWVGPAAEQLVALGASRAARVLLEASVALLPLDRGRGQRLALGELYASLGEVDKALASSSALLAEAARTPDEDARVRIFRARAEIAAGDLEGADATLGDVASAASHELRARAHCERARIQLRRGAFEGAQLSARAGLALAAETDAMRVELSVIAATAAARAGAGAGARAEFEAAEALAERLAGARERALASGYYALELERSGDMQAAKQRYERALEHAREAGDVGQMATYAMNLGSVSYRLGDVERAEASFVLAARLARRVGRLAMALLAELNLADLLVYVGAYARARSVVEGCRSAAGGAPPPLVLAQVSHLLGALAASAGDVERALSELGHAEAQFKALGRQREAAEVLLHAAEYLLDRGGVSDGSAAAARLAQARAAIAAHALHDLQVAYELLAARVRMHNGDVDGALKELAGLEPRAADAADPELAWKLSFALAQGYRGAGALVAAAGKARAAAEQIEALALRLGPDLREGFRRQPQRRAALALHGTLSRDALAQPSSQHGSDTRVVHGVDARFRRLLEVNKRLARERDVDRVLERITDTAIELSGAERGFVLLVDAQGGLGTHVVRVHGGQEGDPHVAFSRSIAEAVLIDGEPIVTVNARDDRRLSEYLSVHKLMLKSVACIPVNGKERTLGVLYLEHRMRAGRFDEQDLDLLVAFADQAAIALENARLWAEVESQRRALASANDELVAAKDELTRVLHARTEELQAVRVSLEKAQASALSRGTRFGIVGRSQAMHRVFGVVERVQQSSVPVVVQGESGTGKELIARAIHSGGVRARGPFITLNCAAVPDTLLESELFGHLKGAFTGADRERRGVFAQAHGGTLFLDEFAEASPRLQVALLRALQEGKVLPVGADVELAVDVRVIVACQRPLAELVAQGKLREDLYYRLSVVELRVPPLRERREDMPELCDHLLRQIAKREQREPARLTRDALDALMRHPLPGNVRQLEHMLVSASMMADGPTLRADAFQRDTDEPRASAPPPLEPAEPAERESTPPEDLGAYKAREKARILDALERHAWNRAKAAVELGMPRRTFYRRLAEFGILEN